MLTCPEPSNACAAFNLCEVLESLSDLQNVLTEPLSCRHHGVFPTHILASQAGACLEESQLYLRAANKRLQYIMGRTHGKNGDSVLPSRVL